jgi:aspartyl-tRNA(Asn)/glutamyl-tRNA(Gln) amidotransferase subunit A
VPLQSLRPTPPRISGLPLRALAKVARGRVGALAIQRVLRAELGIDELASLPDELRGKLPLDVRPLQARPPRAPHDAKLGSPSVSWSGSCDVYTAAYRDKKHTPLETTQRALAAARTLAAHKPSVGPIFAYADASARREAEEATARYQTGNPRGPFDGVPIAVKEMFFIRGLPCQSGATFTDASPQRADGTLVERLRAEGAVILGTTHMTEYGMTPTGASSKRIMPRNPHATDCIAGGSSTGSAVAVATGLVPMAVGADGGGSIRTPSAINGVFGIKPTWGRISRFGVTAADTVSHAGPIGASSVDLARMLEACGGPDEKDPETLHGAPLARGSLVRALGRGVSGLTIAVCRSEWADASDAVARAGKEALAALEKEGAELVDVDLALAKRAPAIGYVTIAVEARAALRTEWRDHADDMSHDLQISFAALDAFTAPEYLDAQRLRVGLRRELAAMFQKVDLLALPTVVATAARVTDAEMQSGFLDAKLIERLCRFAFLANLSGLPAASAPVGRDAEGRPIGLQLVGDAWDEATVLAALAHLERTEAACAERPRVSVKIVET